MVVEPELSRIKTLEGVIAWQAARGLGGSAFSVVTQDELSHDAVVADHGRWVAFGVT